MKYDVIVVGAGAAGCAVAGRLAEDASRSVLLLEAGPDYPDLETLPHDLKYGNIRAAETPESAHNWALRGTITSVQGEIHVAQGKVVGGSSAINGQVWLRGLPEDYDLWASWGNPEWSYLKVLPYLRKMERDLDIQDDFHGSDGPVPVTRRHKDPWPVLQSAFYQACVDAGFPQAADMNGPDATGVGAVPVNNADGIRWSTALTHLSNNRHRLNLTVRGNALARRVLFEGRRAVGVEVESGGEVFTVEGEQIVLSAGGIKSPHLLMLSGVGPAEQLASQGIPLVQELPGVGQNLRNHAIASLSARMKKEVPLATDSLNVRIALRYTSTGSPDINDIMLMANSNFNFLTGEVLPDQGLRLSCALELPAGSGELRLVSPDPTVQPQFNYRYFEHPRDRERMREAVRLGARLLEQDCYREIIEERTSPTDEELRSDDALDQWLLRTVGTARHISGTCKLGPDSDSQAVVDQFCRVRGVEGLRVADASVMPQVIRANTHVTTIMIGERVADWIKAGR